MNIIEFVIKRKTFVSMLFLSLSLLGYISYRNLSIELMPNVEQPYLIVQISASGDMSPQYVEKQAIIPIEGAIGTLEGVNKIESSAQQRRGTIYVYYNQNVNIKYAFLKLQEKVNTILSSIPDEFNISVVKIDTESLSNMFMMLQVRGTGGLERVRAIVEESIIDELENIDGISNVEVTGGQLKSVEIVLDEEASQAHGITPGRIRNLISQSTQQKTFVGQAFENDRYYFTNLVADYADIRDIEDILVDQTGTLRLKDIATVTFGVKEPTSISRINGLDAITMQLIRDANANIIELSNTTQDIIARLNTDLASQDIEIVIQTDTAEEMEKNIDLIINLAITGGFLAVLILWFFLKNFRLVIFMLLAMPISILTALNFFYAFGITLNSLTLVGLALAVGMLLDNSVVVLENIYRHISLGKDRDTAVILGTSEVWRSIFAATLTTVTVFVPFVFSSDYLVKVVGRHIGISIISTLLVSLAVALLFVPMVTHTLLANKSNTGLTFAKVSQKNRLVQIYNVLLKFAIRYPVPTIIGVVITFFLSISLCLMLSLDVSQELELKEFNLYVTMSRGSTLDRTDSVVADLEKELSDIEEIQDIIATIYEEEANLTIVLLDDYEDINGRSITDIKEAIDDRIDDFRLATVSLSEPSASTRFSGGSGADPSSMLSRMFGIGSQSESVVVKGGDFDLIKGVAEDLEYYIGELESVRNTSMNIPRNSPEIHLMLDKQLMSNNNISLNAISTELATLQSEVTSGMVFKQGTEEYDIVIRNENADEEEDKTFEDLQSLQIPNQQNATFELELLGRLFYSYGESRINRIDQEKQIEISYSFQQEVNDSKSLLKVSREEVDDLIAAISIPSGVAIEIIHDESELGEFLYLIIAAFILIYMILASVFESLLTPIVMMFTIPLATIGSFWALILTGNSIMNANSLIGFLILLGVVVNNGIILIDYTRILRGRGFSRSRALMAAGQARVRPILITTITTIVAMIPLAMGNAEYITRIGAPFAITVIGGLTLGTLFTLLFIPSVYSALESGVDWFNGLGIKMKILQISLIALSWYITYSYVNSLLWKTAFFIVATGGIPGFIYFIMNSLRQSNANFFRADETLSIAIRRLVKIYDEPNRFMREWRKGARMKALMEGCDEGKSGHFFESYFWQIPLFGFMIYFIYFYLNNLLWLYILSHVVYAMGFMMISPIGLYIMDRESCDRTSRLALEHAHFRLAFMWGFPLYSLYLFYTSGFRIPVIVFVALTWYMALIVITTSNRLHLNKTNIMRLTGKFAGLRRHFYRFITVIPIIGKKKTPFNALDGVSLNITSGMFGLLGPNGAGKTTLMRVICGIFNQSLGTARINGVDFREKREELQGLIGYLPQEFGTYENITAYEFLDYIAILKNIYDTDERKKIVKYTLESVHLIDKKDHKIGSFSGGMKQRVGIAMTLLHLPRILVVDEPTAGLDPRERIRFRNLLVELSRERIVIFSTHIIEDISSSCNKVAVLEKGSLYYLGDPQKMTASAHGHVWQFLVTPEEFNKIKDTIWVVHHMRADEKIRVRCLSEDSPYPDAVNAHPTLEDAYLWLLGRREK